MRKSFLVIFLVVLVGGGLYIQSRLQLFVKPCAQPIHYSLGTFDSQFNISQTTFLADIDTAVSIWEQPSSKDLFVYDPAAKLKINLIYDNRQQATQKLKSLGYNIDNTQSSYDSLKLRYNGMTASYNSLKRSLDSEIASYEQQRKAYEQQVSYWNKQGGAPKNVAVQLNAQAQSLNSQAAKIQSDQNTLNGLVNDINAAVDVLNTMARNLNLSVANYNSIGQSRGEEFEEGAYVEEGGSKHIDIYEFQNQDSLIRVLAHELGHALGLEHTNSDPDAIMYYLNQGSAEKATAADITELKRVCKMP